MKDKLLDINELVEILGYDSIRGVKTWCITHNIPIIKLGKRYYILEHFLNMRIQKETKIFIESKFENPNQIMDAIEKDDKIEISKLMNAPVDQKVKKEYKEEVKKRSKASETS